jgi:hypothetical protein
MPKRLTANPTHRPWCAVLLATLVVAAMLFPAAAFAAKHFNFRGRTSQNRSVSFQIPYSFRGVTKFTIFWNAKCSSGATLREATSSARTIPFTKITKKASKWTNSGTYNFTQVDPGYSASNGRSLAFKVTVTSNGTIPAGITGIRGTWSTQTVVTDPTSNQTVDTCNTGRLTWKADITA